MITAYGLIFADVDATFEIRAVFNDDSLRHDIAHQHRGLSQFYAVGSGDIPVYFAVNHYFFGVDIGANSAIWTNGETLLPQFDTAFYFAVEKKIFTAGKFAFNHDGFPDMGKIRAILLVGSIVIHGAKLLQEFWKPPYSFEITTLLEN